MKSVAALTIGSRKKSVTLARGSIAARKGRERPRPGSR
jgi:hypothetical protein